MFTQDDLRITPYKRTKKIKISQDILERISDSGINTRKQNTRGLNTSNQNTSNQNTSKQNTSKQNTKGNISLKPKKTIKVLKRDLVEEDDIKKNEIKTIMDKIKQKELAGVNVTLPYKKSVIPFLSKTINDANETHSVNTIMLDENEELIGENTDVLKRHFQSLSISNSVILVKGSRGMSLEVLLQYL